MDQGGVLTTVTMPSGATRMAELIRAHDWAATPFGPIEAWPATLKTAVELMLGMPQPACICWGPDAQFIYNDEYAAVLGTRHPALARSFAELWPEIIEGLRPAVAAVMAGEPYRFSDAEFVLERGGNGAERTWWTGSWTPLRHGDGRVGGFFSTAFETTARVAAEVALRRSEERLQRVLETDAVGVLFFDQDGTVIDANDVFLRLTGYSREDVERRALTWRTMTPPEWVADSERQLAMIEMTGRIGPYEKEYLRKDGSRAWMLFAGRDLGDGTIVEFAIDISDRKRAEAALRDSQQRLTAELADAEALQQVSTELIPEQEPGAMSARLLDAAMALMKADAASVQVLEHDASLRLLASRNLHPDSAAFWQRVDAGSHSTCGRALADRTRIVVADIERCAFMAGTEDLAAYRRSGLAGVQSTPLVARDGRPLGMISTHWRAPHQPSERDFRRFDVLARQASDLIERMQAEAALRESEARHRFLVESTSDMVFQIGLRRPLPLSLPLDEQVDRIFADAYVVAVNDTFARSYGYARAADLAGRPMTDVVPRTPANEAMERALVENGHRAVEAQTEELDRLGQRKVVLNTIVGRIEDGHVLDYFGTSRDITERVRAEEALRESEARFRTLAESIEDVFYITDLERDALVYLSPSYARVWGRPGAELMADLSRFLDTIHPDDRAGFLAGKATQRGGEPVVAEYRIVRPDGEVRWVLDRSFPVHGMETRRAAGIASDITARKAGEEHVRLLVREVSHRSKNMLSVVQAIARNTARDARPEDFARRFGERIAALAEGHDLLVRNDWQGADLGDLVRSQLVHLKELVGTRVHIEGPALAVRPAAAQALGMALHELATNAAKYGALSDGAGRVDVAWTVEPDGGGPAFRMHWREHGGPPVPAARQTGFGRTLMVRMVESALSATVGLEFAPGGVVWQVAAPAERVTELR